MHKVSSHDSGFDLAARDYDVYWHPCAQMRDYREFHPLQIARARGCELHLTDGRVVLDAISSWWCKALGHGHPRLQAAISKQLSEFEHVITANVTHEPVVGLCERLLAAGNGYGAEVWGGQGLIGRQPGHFGKVFLADNGSTGVEIALKMAYQAQQQRGMSERTKFAAFKNGYHGETVAALSVGDMGLFSDPFKKLLFPCTLIEGLAYRSGDGDSLWMDASVEWPGIEAQLEPLAGELAAIIYEPIMQGCAGMQFYSPDLLRRLHQWADAHDVYLIADEIAAGFGRLGKMLAGHHAVSSDEVPDRLTQPDFAVVSKGLTAGYLPMSAVLTTDAVYEIFDAEFSEMRAFYHSNTYTGNALACAVANEVFRVFADEKILDGVAANGPLLLQGLSQLAGERDYLHNPRGCGMVAAIDIRKADGSPIDWQQRTGYRVYREAVQRGALLRPIDDTMYLFPPLNCTASEIERMIAVLAESLDAVM